MLNLVNDPSIPTIGQQLTVDGYTLAVSARCQCKSGGSFVSMTITCSPGGTAVTPGACPSCGFGYSVQGMELDAHARLKFAVAVLTSTPPVQQ